MTSGQASAVEVLVDAIQLVSAERDTTELIRSILTRLRGWTGCEAVGVRLREGDDYPYFQVDGFSDLFVEMENSLCSRRADGSVVRDYTGDPTLDCMCGNILSGRFDPSKPFFTQAGSFWTNSTTELLAGTTEEDRQSRTRDRCNGEGYESVALVPLKASGETIGLLQLNDKQPGRFDASTISTLERIAGALGAALAGRRATDALRASEERYRALFDKSLDGVLLTATDGSVLDANEVACAMLGMTRQEVCARSREDLVAPSPANEAYIAERERTGRVSGVITFVRKDGTSFPADFSSFVIPGTEEMPRTFVIFRDIAARVRGAERLRRSEEMLRYIIKYDPSAIAVFDRDLRYVAVSDRFIADYEVEDHHLLGKRHYDVFPEMPQRWKDVHARVLTGAVERSEDDFFEREDGSITYNSWQCRPWFDVDGSIAGMITYSEVTTERKKAELALKESEQRYRNLFQTMLEGCALCQLVYDDQGEAVDWIYLATNEAFDRMPGFSGVAGRRASEAFPGLLEASPDLLQTYDRVSRTGQPAQFRMRRDPPGRWFDMSVSRSTPGFFVTVLKDVTEALEGEEKLRQSQKMEAVGRLAGGIAHDFNNMLTAIIGYSELLLASLDDEPGGPREDVSEIKLAAERAAGLTRQILAFSRRQTLKPVVVSLNEVVVQAERLLGRTLGEDIALLTDLADGLGLVEVDVSQMEQILMNLAVNARDAMPEGGVLSLLTADVMLDGRDHVLLQVTDTGTGMDADTQARAFEPFFTTKEQGKGTGLGLSTVYGIVSQSEGSISIDSRPGMGTVIRIYLPRVDQPVNAPVAVPAELATFAGDETILIVEDEPAVRALASRVLRSLGYTVVEASTGDDGFMLLAQEAATRPDLLVTDVVLPGHLQGSQLADAVRTLHPDLPVLFMSGHSRDTFGHAGIVEQDVDYLEKPFTPAVLARTVWEVLGRARGAA